MKSKIAIIITEIIYWLIKQRSLIKTNINEENSDFFSLTPTDKADNILNYEDALRWAISNSSKIRNIAISGAYGSGKSSFIQTFIRNNPDILGGNFLNISLATFTDTTYDNPEKSNDRLRLIELSILQQLFYHEEDTKIPDSRFRKIKSFKKGRLVISGLAAVIFLNSILYKLYPDFLNQFALIEFPQKADYIFNFITSAVILISTFLIILRLIRVLQGLTITKLNINNAEIEISEKVNKSILNQHIDEILYFFEVTKRQFVFIEDLDRFNQTEVFTKLREINALINQSKKVKQDVVFVYAVRDELFQDKERTKFFDFIIPIVPVINSSNSLEKLIKINKTFNYKLSSSLLEDLSLFIDDMRLLNSTMNEFRIYSKTIGNTLDQNKLLGIIAYKNLFPSDFYLLSQGNGYLHSVLNKKNIYIKNKIDDLDEGIKDIKDQVIDIEKHQFNDLEELRSLYIFQIVIDVTRDNRVHGFFIENESTLLTSKNMTQDGTFKKIIEGKLMYSQNGLPNYRVAMNYDFKKIEQKVSTEYSYKQREKLILDNKKIDELKNQISKFELEKEELKKLKVKDVIQRSHISIPDSINQNQENLLFVLIKNGYISDDYSMYISLFYEESLTREDYQFLINVKSEIPSEFDYDLQRIPNILKRVNVFDFEKEYTLNYGLAETLVSNDEYLNQREKLLLQLSTGNETSLKFIDGFLQITQYKEEFIRLICKVWPKIWDTVLSAPVFTTEDHFRYLELILNHASIEDISVILQNDLFRFNSNAAPLLLIKSEDRTKEIIKTLNLRVNDIPLELPEKIKDFIVDNRYYSIQISSLKSIFIRNEEFNLQEFEQKNWSAVLSSNQTSVIEYIKSDLNTYIENVFNKLPNNNSESEKNITSLLNNSSVSFENKLGLISKSKVQITNIHTVEDKELWSVLFSKIKILPKWNNVLMFYEHCENKISSDLIVYLNNMESAKELSNHKMPNEKEGIKTFSSLCKSLVEESRLNDDAFQLITKCSPWWYSDLSLESHSELKIKYLIDNTVLTPTLASIELLRKVNHSNMVIKLLERYTEKLLEYVADLKITGDELNQVLESKKISSEQKLVFINNSDLETIASNTNNLQLIADLKVNEIGFSISPALNEAILLDVNTDIETRILFFNKTSNLEEHQVEAFLESLGKAYQKITNKRRKAELPINELNKLLLNKLVGLGYISSYSSRNEKEWWVNHKRS